MDFLLRLLITSKTSQNYKKKWMPMKRNRKLRVHRSRHQSIKHPVRDPLFALYWSAFGPRGTIPEEVLITNWISPPPAPSTLNLLLCAFTLDSTICYFNRYFFSHFVSTSENWSMERCLGPPKLRPRSYRAARTPTPRANPNTHTPTLWHIVRHSLLERLTRERVREKRCKSQKERARVITIDHIREYDRP